MMKYDDNLSDVECNIMIIMIMLNLVPARARCMWSKSELARQTWSERPYKMVSIYMFLCLQPICNST